MTVTHVTGPAKGIPPPRYTFDRLARYDIVIIACHLLVAGLLAVDIYLRRH